MDIRPPQAFAQVRIPGSLNIPLFAIKTKTFLKGKPLILVDEGYRPRQLADACEQLTRAGFTARFLFGGLAAWQTSGGRMQGDAFARNGLNQLSPQAFFAVRESADWLVIDASVGTLPAIQESGLPVFPIAQRIPFQRNRPEQFAADVEHTVTHVSPRPKRLLVVIFNQDGSEYGAIERALCPTSIAPVFFLEGGWAALTRYADQQHALKQKQSQKSTDSCRRPCAR